MADKAFLESKGNVIPEGARMAGSWTAPNAPSGNVIAVRSGTKVQLYDKASGKLFATTTVPANATTSVLAQTIRNTGGNTTQFQAQQMEQQIKSAGFAENSLEAAFVRATGKFDDVGKYNLTVDKDGNVVAVSKELQNPMFADLGASRDVLTIDPSTNKVISTATEGEQLVWNQFQNKFTTASIFAKTLQEKKNEFYDQLDREKGLAAGTTRGMAQLMDGLVQVSDKLATAAAFVGVPTFVIDVYKAFAPPTSEFYQAGTIEQKFEKLIQDPTFLTTIATGGLGQALAKFKGLPTTIIEKNSDLDKALKAIDVLVKTTNVGAKIQETAGDTIEQKVRNFAANKADKVATAIEFVAKDTGEQLKKAIEENIRMPEVEFEMKKPEEVGTTTVTEPVAPPQETGEQLGTPTEEVATGETVITDTLAQETPAVKTGGVVESAGQKNLRKFRQNGNRFRAKGGAFGAQRF